MKLILFPLVIMFVLSIFSMLGLGIAPGFGNGNVQIYGGNALFYDAHGRAVCYANGTSVDPNEDINLISSEYGGLCMFTNHTGIGINPAYPLFYDADSTDHPVMFKDVVSGGGPLSVTANVTGSMGLVALIVGLMGLATVAGLRILGNGVSDISVDALFKGTAYLTLWGIFSLMTIWNLVAIPVVGSVFYFFLTALFTLGVVNSVGHPSGGD